MKRLPWLALAATLASWLLSSGPAGAGERFALLREAVASEPLRLWTGHLVHFNAAHLRGDLIAFAVWAALVEWRSRRVLALLLAVAPPVLSVSLLVLHPSLDEYRGLSALDCALVMALLVLHRGERPRLVVVAAAAFVLKSCFELATGHALLAPELGQGVRLLPSSHLLGAALGALVAAVTGVGYSERWLSPAGLTLPRPRGEPRH